MAQSVRHLFAVQDKISTSVGNILTHEGTIPTFVGIVPTIIGIIPTIYIMCRNLSYQWGMLPTKFLNVALEPCFLHKC